MRTLIFLIDWTKHLLHYNHLLWLYFFYWKSFCLRTSYIQVAAATDATAAASEASEAAVDATVAADAAASEAQ